MYHNNINDLLKIITHLLIFVLPGECVQNRASPLKRFTQSGSVLSGDGPGPGWAHRGIWQVQSLIILLCQMRTMGIIKEALPYLHTRTEEITSSTQHWIKKWHTALMFCYYWPAVMWDTEKTVFINIIAGPCAGVVMQILDNKKHVYHLCHPRNEILGFISWTLEYCHCCLVSQLCDVRGRSGWHGQW